MLINHVEMGRQERCETPDPVGDFQHGMLALLAGMELVYAFLPQMLERGRGVVINVASAEAAQPRAVYAATQAFHRAYSQALGAVCRAWGVRVLALSGAADSRVRSSSGLPARARGPKFCPVVEQALRAVERGQSTLAPGSFNALLEGKLWRLAPMNRMLRHTNWLGIMRSQRRSVPKEMA